jgi:hypothetical protein
VIQYHINAAQTGQYKKYAEHQGQIGPVNQGYRRIHYYLAEETDQHPDDAANKKDRSKQKFHDYHLPATIHTYNTFS